MNNTRTLAMVLIFTAAALVVGGTFAEATAATPPANTINKRESGTSTICINDKPCVTTICINNETCNNTLISNSTDTDDD